MVPDSTEIVRLWPGTPPGGAGVRLTLQVAERSPTPQLFQDRAATGIGEPILTVYRPQKPDGSAVLLAPGGGYARVVVDKEGIETALLLNQHGVTAFILRYRLPSEGWANGADVSLQDAQRAMRLIRAHAKDYGIDPARLGVLGFSAGGHVGASLATRFAAPVYAPIDAADNLDAKPAYAGLLYPVITMLAPYTETASRDALLGKDAAPDRLQAYSCQNMVTGSEPPCFLCVAADDQTIPVENTLLMNAALRAKSVPTELHVFETGGHGFGIRLAQGNPCSIWPALFLRWGAKRGFFGAI